MVRKQKDKAKLLQKLKDFDFHEFFTLQKSGLAVERLSYCRIMVRQDHKPLGSHYRNANLPTALVKNRYVITSGNLGKRKNPEYCNNLCVFESLAQHFKAKGVRQLEDGTRCTTLQLFRRYCRERGIEAKAAEFMGIDSYSDMDLLEQLCGTAIQVCIPLNFYIV